MSGWTLTASQTYTYEISFWNESITLASDATKNIIKEISKVIEEGTELTERSSIAEVESNAGSYWQDDSVKKIYVHTVGSDCPSVHTVVG